MSIENALAGALLAELLSPAAVLSRILAAGTSDLVGLRVVRGPDWKWGDQDGGEGGLGTVEKVMAGGTVLVLWDHGSRNQYRNGAEGARDLSIYDNVATGVRHPSVTCDECKTDGISGFRWKCAVCHDYDLCQTCYMDGKHSQGHEFIRFDTPKSAGIKVEKRAKSVRVNLRGILPGSIVRRGVDWKWGNQDGGNGLVGTVVKLCDWDDRPRSGCTVQWVLGTNNYRLGFNGYVDVRVVRTSGSNTCYYKTHLPALEIEGSSTSTFKAGDKVKLTDSVDEVKTMMKRGGIWEDSKEKFITAVGTVHGVTDSGKVIVQYDGAGSAWGVASSSLEKVGHLEAGDNVRLCSDADKMKNWQEGHGGWNDGMVNSLGKTGEITRLYEDGDVRVKVKDNNWCLNPACCTWIEESDDDSDSEDEGTLLLGALLAAAAGLRLGGIPQIISAKQAFVTEAAQGNLMKVKAILAKDPDLLNADFGDEKRTALHTAAIGGHSEVVQFLLSRSADINIPDSDNDRPIHNCVHVNRPEILEMLLQHGANVNLKNDKKSTALHLAVVKQQVKSVALLLKYKADVRQQDSNGNVPLYLAFHLENQKISEMLMADPRNDFSIVDDDGFNLLHKAAIKGLDFAVKSILAKDERLVTMKKSDGFTPLHIAAFNNHLSIVKILLDTRSIEIDSRTRQEYTSLHLALSRGFLEVVQTLADKGADVNAQDEDGDSCLHLALSCSKSMDDGEEAAQIAKKLGLPIRDCSMGAAMACVLIDKGADITTKNNSRKTPLDLVNANLGKALKNYEAKAKLQPSSSNNSRPGMADTPTDCMICGESPPQVTFQPCGHTVVCRPCSARAKKCTFCQKAVKAKVEQSMQRETSMVKNENSLSDMRKQAEKMEKANLCGKCQKRQRALVFLCGHSACETCADGLKVCYSCKSKVKKTIKLF